MRTLRRPKRECYLSSAVPFHDGIGRDLNKGYGSADVRDLFIIKDGSERPSFFKDLLAYLVVEILEVDRDRTELSGLLISFCYQ